LSTIGSGLLVAALKLSTKMSRYSLLTIPKLDLTASLLDNVEALTLPDLPVHIVLNLIFHPRSLISPLLPSNDSPLLFYTPVPQVDAQDHSPMICRMK